MHDLLADEYILYQNVFDKAEEIASYYGFKPIQTPHLESAELLPPPSAPLRISWKNRCIMSKAMETAILFCAPKERRR